MKLFLVRHGKTNAEELGNRQSPDSVLSKVGELQSSLVGKRLSKEKFDLIISSPWQRAKQTAQAIVFEGKVEVKYLDLLREKEHDPRLYGVKNDSRINQKYLKELSGNFWNFDWTFLNGETLEDTIKRAKKVRDFLLKDYKEKRIIVVSHGLFLRCFIITCLFNDCFDKNIFMNLFHSISLDCASLSEMEYNEDRDIWQLISLNDREHLRTIACNI